ncbi:amino acid adenylation enzyme/thioester reductase family protein,thioester reductase-like protein [Xenorhabdus mauleonii]|uniref:Amino acid adenylation domain-containing protein/thioester reductase domain-containing protein n=1 Tax=Xenorhabdus mauleonii TaxID=351675 RepID=A0A1I3TQW1_9GAMM|nr:thioester reductase domain-containing protein [Xenorhabdus mauleonii]PHM37090.1 amino acid adenylation enzyme/thioester reductase family protein,thioester reductase-like protein [Xenorhabdus mauleonii]SFJ71937.1 amino acid adenylation domain-containing protein/thioester reductase domain-containing protein [Xenorhabdus mauleonii]
MNTYTHKAILHTAFTGQKSSPALDTETAFDTENISNISQMTAELKPWFTNVPARLAELAQTVPNDTAVSDPHETLTFGVLNQRIEKAAQTLRHYGVKMGSNVAIAAQRGISWFVTMQAIWRLGAVYIPLNTMMPEKRLNDILASLPESILVSDKTVSAGLKASTLISMDVILDNINEINKPEFAGDIDIPALGDHPAYVMFTSGSTGLPKSVQVQHDNLAACLCGFGKLLSVSQDDHMLALTTFSFDISVLELLLTIVHGGSIYIASIDTQRDAMALSDTLSDPSFTFAQATPVTWSMALNAGWKPRPEMGMLCGGEALSQDLADQLTATGGSLWNVYGPTETTIWSTAFRMKKGDKVQLGGPIPGTSITIVDKYLRPVPKGTVGEILIGGLGVTAGYRNNPTETAKRYVPDITEKGKRAYLTGDMARMLDDGSLIYMGRQDDQVKVRGYRIELGEIEIALRKQQGVQDAIIRVAGSGDFAKIQAFVLFNPNMIVPEEWVRETQVSLREILHEAWIPTEYYRIPYIPLTSSGKRDKKRLEEVAERLNASSDAVQPQTETEKRVYAIWRDLLATDVFGITDDFFQIGGHSILVARMVENIEKAFSLRIPISGIYVEPTIARISAILDEMTIARQINPARIAGTYHSEALIRQHAKTLRNDVYLKENVRPDGLPHANWYQPDTVLLTGSTGYLGLHLLEQLLKQTSARIICLCRASDEEHARDRIKAGFKNYQIDVGNELKRVDFVVGDLGQPRFGLLPETWAQLAENVDVIYHNGALVNFIYPYSALKSINVDGTRTALELACTARLKHFHYVSSVNALFATESPRPYLEDDRAMSETVRDPSGYSGSKWVSEGIINIARKRGVPVSIYRPGLILGHTRTGAAQGNDYLIASLKGYLAMGFYPEHDLLLDITPVDYVAASLVHISKQADSNGKFFNLFNPVQVSIRQFFDWVQDFGYILNPVPFDEGKEKILALDDTHPLYPLIPLIRDMTERPYRALDPAYIDEIHPELELKNTLSALTGSDIRCPTVTAEYVHQVLRYLIGTGFLPALLPERFAQEAVA